MSFNSFAYFIFFPAVVLVYFLLPHKYRRFFLLLASCYFYMAFIPKYILILFAVILVDYFAAIQIEKHHGPKRKLFLILSIISNLGILIFFKYYGFLSQNLTDLAQAVGWNLPLPVLQVILPLGLSFHTFQALSYTIEVYKGKWQPERNIITYALYVMFFPQLVAGPIERPAHLLPQFYEEHNPEPKNFAAGLKRILWGLFKKIVVADHLAVTADLIFKNLWGEYAGLAVIIGVLFFSFQIYYDFSGYCDIALGSAKILGFELRENFNNPYWSRSISEFWHRWHMSLSAWFRDYVYIPLGGNREGKTRWQANIIITFLLSGLWHGAGWMYVLWGGLHGSYMVFAQMTKNLRQRFKAWIGLVRFPRLDHAIQIIIVFILVSFAWIFFRADNLVDAINGLVNIVKYPLCSFLPGAKISCLGELNLTGTAFLALLAAIVFVETVSFLDRKNQNKNLLLGQPTWLKWTVYYILIIGILFFGFHQTVRFIYFQF